jgi:hypothetical protein
MTATDTDRAKVAEVLWHGTVGGTEDRVVAYVASERAAAVTDLRARVLALADEMDAELAARGILLDRCIRPGDALRAAVSDTTGGTQ